jgi:hypothetical protein
MAHIFFYSLYLYSNDYLLQAIGRLSSGSLNKDVGSLATKQFDKDYILIRKDVEQLKRRHIPFNVQGIYNYLRDKSYFK